MSVFINEGECVRFRKATREDVFLLITLYQKASLVSSARDEELFLNYRKLESALDLENALWLLTENEKGVLVAALGMWIEEDQRLCKINKMLVDPGFEDPDGILRASLRNCLSYLAEVVKNIDVVYTTTISMSLSHQYLTLEEGFRILGVFPNLTGEDNSHLNGVSAYFFPGVLNEKRTKNLTLHPRIYPFFAISRDECHLEEAKIAEDVRPSPFYREDSYFYEPLPQLELVTAPLLVQKRFELLRKNHSQMTHFYPFYRPNGLIMDADEEIQIFCRINEKLSFAAIIGEHLSKAICPVSLYKEVQVIFRNSNLSYIEIINDASDVYGNECIFQAGFTPCAYFPAFKLQGQSRRDFVVFGKSSEYLCRPNLQTHPSYIKFYREYFKIEGKNYFPDF